MALRAGDVISFNVEGGNQKKMGVAGVGMGQDTKKRIKAEWRGDQS